MMENEKKFFNKLYDEMLLSGFISDDDIKSRDDKIKAVTTYLDKLKRVHDKAIYSPRVNDLELLKSFYHKKYIIKKEDIPNSYYEKQAKIAFEKGLGNININKEKIANDLIEDQKQSLDIWLDYLFSKDASFYPYELKYWAFQGMLKMGGFDKEKKEFTRRSKTTVNMFIDLNKEALALTINEMDKYLSHSNIDDNTLNKLLSNGSFSKLYTYFYNKLNNQTKDDINSNEGIWIKYDKGSNHLPLVKSLEGMATGWCTAGEATAKKQLANGDFYVYYTKDKDGNFKIPRLAIRMDDDFIEEIRGVATDQNIESEMEEILEKKLEEFPDSIRYGKQLNDMRLMTIIYEKQNNGIELTIEELIFLYEIKGSINSFGYLKDPRIEEIKIKRNFKKDLATIFNCKEDAVTDDIDELYTRSQEIVCFYGNLRINDNIEFKKLKCIVGNANFSKLKNAFGLNNLQIIVGNANFSSLTTANDLVSLQTIGGNANFSSLVLSEGLEQLRVIGGEANFSSLENARGLKSLEILEKDVDFSSLVTSEGLENLQLIGGNAHFNELESAKGLSSLEIIGKDAKFHKLTTAEGLSKLKIIGGFAGFFSLTSAVGLKSLKMIKDSAIFDNLKSAKGLEHLEIIGKDANFDKLVMAQGLNRLNRIGKDAYFYSLEDARGLENLESIGDCAYFNSLTTTYGLSNKLKIMGSINLDSLINGEDKDRFKKR